MTEARDDLGSCGTPVDRTPSQLDATKQVLVDTKILP